MDPLERELKTITRKHIDYIERKLNDWYYSKNESGDGDGYGEAFTDLSAEEKSYREIKHELTICFFKSEMPSDELVLKVRTLISG